MNVDNLDFVYVGSETSRYVHRAMLMNLFEQLQIAINDSARRWRCFPVTFYIIHEKDGTEVNLVTDEEELVLKNGRLQQDEEGNFYAFYHPKYDEFEIRAYFNP